MILGRFRRQDKKVCSHARVFLDPIVPQVRIGGEDLLLGTLVCRDCQLARWGLWLAEPSELGPRLGRLRRGLVPHGSFPAAFADVGYTEAEIEAYTWSDGVSLVDGVPVPGREGGDAASGPQGPPHISRGR